MPNFLFDVKLFASIRVDADNLSHAREKLAALLDCATGNFGADPETGAPVLGEVSLFGDDDEARVCDLIEIDGEPV